MIYELGTFSAPNGVIRIKEGIAGLILVSRVTRSTKKWKEIYYSHLLSKVRTGSWKFIYHTLIHTFAILNYPPHFVPDSLGVKCELRDVIHSLHLPT